MNHGWRYITSDECFSSITPKCKIEKKNYSNGSLIPIISQEEDFISGYWDNYADITPHSRPIVVFGDHSRVLKYIDFDFVVGADGVKILLPHEPIDAKFLYYFLKWKKIPSLGYSRHFRLLKELKYPCPHSKVQTTVISELDKITELIEVKRSQLADLDLLAKSLFYEMFGDPITNPKGWENSTIGDVASVQTGATPSREISDYYIGDIPWVKTTEVQNCDIYETEEHISRNALENSNCKLFPLDTIIVAMYGQGKTRGQIARLKIEACTNQACAAILPCPKLHPLFLYAFLRLSYESLRSIAVGCNQKNLNLSLVKNYTIFLPPILLQNEFAAKLEAIEEQKKLIKSSIKDLRTLFASRMDYWFNEI